MSLPHVSINIPTDMKANFILYMLPHCERTALYKKQETHRLHLKTFYLDLQDALNNIWQHVI